MPSKIDRPVVFAGYRDWADRILETLTVRCGDLAIIRVDTPEALSAAIEGNRPGLVLLAGWSWILPEQELAAQPVFGLHPSDLPDYAGGSPIQHQIIDGVRDSKLTLFRLTPQLDHGPTVYKADLSLDGHLDEIFGRIADAGADLMERLLRAFPNHPEQQEAISGGQAKIRRRLKPDTSRLEKSELGGFTCEELYNLIRAREDPYPNVYIEDESGRLLFKRVEFQRKESK